VVTEYKRIKVDMPEHIRDVHPYMRSYVAFPVLPGVIATYYEYSSGILAGFGGWELHFWYFAGTKKIGRHASWVR
jgi:hypothetical protein